MVLSVEGVTKIYNSGKVKTRALNNISFTVKEGEFVAIMGPSGSGKTTLLNVIATIDRIDEGIIKIARTNICGMSQKKLAEFRRKNLGFIFQEFNLLEILTVRENIAVALTINRENPLIINERINKLCQKLDILDILDKYPTEISGGQRQRVACARAMITLPSIILADEPTGSLDSNMASVFMDTLQKINNEDNTTILMVTHDPFCASYAKRVMFLKDGKLFDEIINNTNSSKFLNNIMKTMKFLGGEC